MWTACCKIALGRHTATYTFHDGRTMTVRLPNHPGMAPTVTRRVTVRMFNSLRGLKGLLRAA